LGGSWHCNIARVYTLGQSSPLIVGEEKHFISSNRPAQRPAKLVLVKCAARGRKIVARIEVGVAQELERVAVKFVGARFRNHVDLSSAVSSVFRVEVAGKDAELGNGVEVRNDRR